MHYTEMEQRIIDGASSLFFRFGYSKVRVDEIADYARCTKKTIYNHFPTKLDLLHEVIKTSIHEIISNLQQIAGNSGYDFLQKLTRILEYLFLQLTIHKRNLMEEFGKYTSEADLDVFPNVREKVVPIIQDLIDEGIAGGLVKAAVSKELLPYTCLSLVWGEMMLYRRFSLSINPGELLVGSINHILGGILTPQGEKTLLQEGKKD